MESLPRRGLEQRVDLLHRHCGSGGEADSSEVLRAAGSMGEGDEGSGRKMDTSALLWRWRIAKRVGVLVYVCLGRRVFGAGFVHGLLGFAANGSGSEGNWQAWQVESEALGVRKARGMAGAWQGRVRLPTKSRRWLTSAADGCKGRESGKSAEEEKMGSNSALECSG